MKFSRFFYTACTALLFSFALHVFADESQDLETTFSISAPHESLQKDLSLSQLPQYKKQDQRIGLDLSVSDSSFENFNSFTGRASILTHSLPNSKNQRYYAGTGIRVDSNQIILIEEKANISKYTSLIFGRKKDSSVFQQFAFDFGMSPSLPLQGIKFEFGYGF